MQEESAGDPTKTTIGDNPDHKMLMAWKEDDDVGKHTVYYHHGSMGLGLEEHNYIMHDEEDMAVGAMGLNKKGYIMHIETHPELRRKGIATKLYSLAKNVSKDIPSIPSPQHTTTRTELGDAWARGVNKNAPENKDLVEESSYRGINWKSLRGTSINDFKSHLNEFHAKLMSNVFHPDAEKEARFHFDSAHDYLDQAAKHPRNDDKHFAYLNMAEDNLHELGDLHDDHFGDMEQHTALMHHFGKVWDGPHG